MPLEAPMCKAEPITTIYQIMNTDSTDVYTHSHKHNLYRWVKEDDRITVLVMGCTVGKNPTREED